MIGLAIIYRLVKSSGVFRERDRWESKRGKARVLLAHTYI